ncbi:MAG: glycosyltransferase family 39 protein [Dehalococcoidia bacterium]
MTEPQTRMRVVVLLAAAIHAVMGLISLGAQSLWLDEVMSLEIATASWAESATWFRALPEQHPLYYLLLRGWTFVFGTTDVGLRALSLVFGVAAVPLAARLTSRLFGPDEAAVAAVLLGISPFWLYYSQEGRPYTLLVALVILATLAWLNVAQDDRDVPISRWPYWLVASLGMYTHFFFAFIVMAHALASFVLAKDWRSGLRNALLVGVPVLVAYLPWLWLILTHMPEGQDWKGLRHVVFGVPYTFVRFAIGYGQLVADYRWQDRIVELLRANALLLLAAGLSYGVLIVRGTLAVRRTRRVARVLITTGFLLPLFLPLILTPVVILSGERYFMVILPFFVMLAAAGVRSFARSASGGARLLGLGAVIGLSLVTARSLHGHYFNPDFGNEQWEEVLARIAAEGPEDAIVVVAPDMSEETLRYHLGSATEFRVEVWLPAQGAPDLPDDAVVWLLVTQLHDPATVTESFTPEWEVESQRLFPKATGIWLIRLRRAEERTGTYQPHSGWIRWHPTPGPA